MPKNSISIHPNKPQMPALTGIRFFLALWVVVYHQSTASGTVMGHLLAFRPPVLICLIRTGYLAVGVFFALSGFVLAYSYSLENKWSLRNVIDFAVARFARIYPAYSVGVLLMAPLVLLNILQSPHKRLLTQIAEAGLNCALLQAWIPTHALSWNMPGWSLSAEAFFYLCFPFVGVVLWRASHKLSRIPFLLVGFWLLAVTGPLIAIRMGVPGLSDVPATASNLGADPFWANLFKLNPLLRLPEFCFGILLVRLYGLLQQRMPSLSKRGYLLYIPGLLLEIAVISRANQIPFPLMHNGILLPVHGMVMLGLAFGGGSLVSFLSSSGLRTLGNASYSMYILHWPVYEYMNLMKIRHYGQPLSGFAEFLLYASVVILLSILVHRFIEEPGNRIIKRLWSKRRSEGGLQVPRLLPLSLMR